MRPVLGVDTSAHVADLPPDTWDRLDAHGCRFLITRASRGLDATDTTAVLFAEIARARSWLFGSYHFMEPGDGRLQAEHYLRAYPPTRQGAMPQLHVLDVEVDGLRWVAIVEYVERLRREGLRVGVYTRETFWDTKYPAARLDLFDYEWLADWTVGSLSLPTWDTLVPAHPSRLHQFGQLKVPRVGPAGTLTVGLDGNLWHGSIEELARL